jgi:UDP-N-acetylmuramate dehydrogenase
MQYMTVEKNFPLLKFNTFGFNVKANLFVEVFTIDELRQVLVSTEFSSIPKLILGGGSNILFTKDFDGLVIKISIGGMAVVKDINDSVLVEAGAGVEWHQLVLYSIDNGLNGLENLSLIPGTAGAAPIQNIGAYGLELKDVFHSLKAIDICTGEVREFSKEDCQFGYRSSIFKHELKNKYVIVSVTLLLHKKSVVNITYGSIKSELEKQGITEATAKDISRVICGIRTSKLPDPLLFGNAGSFYKNPIIPIQKFLELEKQYPGISAYKADGDNMKVAAGWLIENAGWRGKKFGNAASYEKQALVLVNTGNASPDEILALSCLIKDSVNDKFGILLEEEVNII